MEEILISDQNLAYAETFQDLRWEWYVVYRRHSLQQIKVLDRRSTGGWLIHHQQPNRKSSFVNFGAEIPEKQKSYIHETHTKAALSDVSGCVSARNIQGGNLQPENIHVKFALCHHDIAPSRTEDGDGLLVQRATAKTRNKGPREVRRARPQLGLTKLWPKTYV